ncbi:MAG: methyltransferase domain-containing protein [Deltaproteobacteria bacterium]|nr:MAG: methyltransferase domain-containing protein [Deltaproteobacteria bacterium]
MGRDGVKRGPVAPAEEAPARIHAQVAEYYGRVLSRSEDLKTSACCAAGPPPPHLAARLGRIHEAVQARFYGCGFPLPEALEGATVVDLGCGSGRDVYLAAQLVGEGGFVHGVDMTEAQLEVARETLPWHMERFGYARPNVAFHQAYIEDLSALPIEPGSVDVVISNCVFNLSPRKDLVLAECHRLLAEGGELYFSDVFCDRRLPEAVRNDPELYGECLGGAMYVHDFFDLARATAFLDPRIVARAPIEIGDPALAARVGPARFQSLTLRLFKIPGLEPRCEDYGQIAIYRGGLEEAPARFRLDDHHLFEVGRPERVCGNTAAMLSQTRLGRYFEVHGDTSTHFGLFSCAPAASDPPSAGEAGGPCC